MSNGSRAYPPPKQRPGTGGGMAAPTNVRRGMDGNVTGFDTPEGPVGTNNPATVRSDSLLDQPPVPLKSPPSALAERQKMRQAINPAQVAPPAQPGAANPAPAFTTPAASAAPPSASQPIRSAMDNYPGNGLGSMLPKATDSPLWDKKPATVPELVNPSGGNIPGILSPDQQSGDVKINRLTGKPFGWRPGDPTTSQIAAAATPKAAPLTEQQVNGKTTGMSVTPQGTTAPTSAADFSTKTTNAGIAVENAAMASASPVKPGGLTAPTSAQLPPPSPASMTLPQEKQSTATGFHAAMPTPSSMALPQGGGLSPNAPVGSRLYKAMSDSPTAAETAAQAPPLNPIGGTAPTPSPSNPTPATGSPATPSPTKSGLTAPTEGQKPPTSNPAPAAQPVPENGHFEEMPFSPDADPMVKYAALKQQGYTHQQAAALSGWKEKQVQLPDWQKGTALGKLRTAINL